MKRLALLALTATAFAAEKPIPPVPDKQPEPPFAKDNAPGIQMLVPGFTVRELPVKLTSLNNIEYAADGRLFAGGYDGRFHVLRDTDGDGLEDRVDTFSPETTANYPLGMAVKDGDLYATLTDEIIRWRDTDGDGIPDKRETVAKGFDDPALVTAPYLNHRRVDSSMALAFAPDGSLLTTMGNAGYNNAYWHDKQGVAHYSTDKRRGCLLRIGTDGKVMQLHSGLRYIMSLQFNQHGDLFGTDQEGATWVPNGNPFDELLHIPLSSEEKSRHFGFPPRHPRWLPDVVDEPSVFDYAPQHESTCGFRFNGPAPGRGRFGPEWWAGDAIVTGESRGKLWRTKLAKTAAGYVAQTQLIARCGLMIVDCAISPKGDLVVCCHTGKPDWGNGPKGEGRIFKISYTDKAAPLPVLAWAQSETETIITFDRKPSLAWVIELFEKLRVRFTIDSGRYLSAADNLETIHPPYTVVRMQRRQPRNEVPVTDYNLYEKSWARQRGYLPYGLPFGSLDESFLQYLDVRTIAIKNAPRTTAMNYVIDMVWKMPPQIPPEAPPNNVVSNQPQRLRNMAHALSGVSATWKANPEATPRSDLEIDGWLPHPDFSAAREFTVGSSTHDEFWQFIQPSGTLTLRGQLDLWQMLIPATQPLSKLDYTPEPETVTVTFKSDAALKLEATGAKVERVSANESRLTVEGTRENVWPAFTLKVATPAKSLDVSFFTNRDARPRALPLRRFLMPFAKPGPPDDLTRTIPEIAGGNWEAGRALFKGKATCANCHQLRGEGFRVGPELSNLAHRDYASVLKDITDPNAMINPDAIGYTVTMKDGTTVVGTRLAQTEEELQIAQPGGAVAKLDQTKIAKTEPMSVSLMPAGLDKVLTAEELRDLMTFLLTEPASKK